MNFLEINKIFGEMIQNTQIISIHISISSINEALTIDKNLKK